MLRILRISELIVIPRLDHPAGRIEDLHLLPVIEMLHIMFQYEVPTNERGASIKRSHIPFAGA